MIDGYEKLNNGLIKQTHIFNTAIKYDKDYIHTYEGFGELGVRMSYLRLANLLGAIGKKPKSILDVGYGSGDFLKVTTQSNIQSFGTDISGYPTPENVKFIEWLDVFNKHFDVITFFDSLEHFDDISFIKNLRCNYIVVSLPECHNFSDEWFVNWKHRKPDEHLWHFSENSMYEFMKENGYKSIVMNNVEDLIRKSSYEYSNILTGVFKKNC